MSDTVLDVLLYLFETYSDQEPPDYKPGSADQDVLREELLKAGFGEPEVDSALDWLDGLNETSAPFAGVPGDRSIRVYNEVELRRLDLGVPRLPAVPGADRHPVPRPARSGHRPAHGAGLRARSTRSRSSGSCSWSSSPSPARNPPSRAWKIWSSRRAPAR